MDTLKRNVTDKVKLAAAHDEDSKLGAYLSINTNLEFQRIIVTRYHTGSHNLRIEKDRRLPNSRREDHLCICNTGVQTVKHVFLHCPLLNDIQHKYGIVDIEHDIHNDKFLLEMECILGIK